ncbi:hypothetical protein Tco_0910661 [Tanacetum coccineum]|uniref:Endonuclease/exonuclease/phosphatase domain-containing protein n=1 Tax=Tanacetum coccineum TaxID=301880 RepID=A0ABQ5CTI1_9ASTR
MKDRKVMEENIEKKCDSPPSLEKLSRVNPETVNNIHKSANKYDVLAEEMEMEEYEKPYQLQNYAGMESFCHKNYGAQYEIKIFLSGEVLQSKVQFTSNLFYRNSGIERRILWKELETQKNIVGNLPWLVLGDFNVTMDSSEHSSGGSFRTLDVTTRNFPISNLAVCVKCLAWKSLLDLGPVWGCDRLVSRAKVIENQVMAISVISVSSDSSGESVGTPARRVILFDSILITIPDTAPTISPPTTHTDTTMTPIEIPTILPTILPTVPPSLDHTPALPNITPASPDYSLAYDTEFDPYEDPSSDHILPLPAISPFLSLADDTTDSDTPDTPPSPTHGTPFTEITPFTHRSPVVPRRRVMILAPGQPIPYRRPYRYHLTGPLHMLTARKRVGTLPTHRLVVRNSVDHSLSNYSSPDDSARDSSSNSSSEASSPMTYVPTLSPVSGALSPVRADLIPSPKRVRDSDYLADVKVNPRESSKPSRSRGTDIRVDDHIKRIDKSYSEHEIDPMQAIIEACFDFADIIRSRGIDVRVVAETVARDEIRTDTIAEFKEDNRRLRWYHECLGSETLTDIPARLKMPNTRSGASTTHEEIKDLVSRRVAEEMEARKAAMNLEPLNENEDGQKGKNRGNRNGENRGNGNGGNGGDGIIEDIGKGKWRKLKWRKERKWKQKWESWHDFGGFHAARAGSRDARS